MLDQRSTIQTKQEEEEETLSDDEGSVIDAIDQWSIMFSRENGNCKVSLAKNPNIRAC